MTYGCIPQLREFFIKLEIFSQVNLGILPLPNNSSPFYLKGCMESCLICKSSVFEVQPFKNKRNVCSMYVRA